MIPHLEHVLSCSEIPHLISYAKDGSGYVREAAIKRCVALAAPELLPAIVACLNDWVPQVRHAARAASITLLPFIPASHWMAVLPSIHQLLAAGRTDHSVWLATFEGHLLEWLDTDHLVEGVRCGDAKMARACFHILEQHKLITPPELLALALGSRSDIVLSLQAVRMCARMPQHMQPAAYLTALRSHFGAVRTIALSALLAPQCEANAHDIAMGALFDVQSSVRSLAIAFLLKQEVDVGSVYRLALEARSTVKVMQVALTSLASLRRPDDVALFQSFAQDASGPVRLVALASWFKTINADKDLIALAALADDAPRVRKFAIDLVRKHGAYIPMSTARACLAARRDFALLWMFSQSDKWNWIESVALVALAGPHDNLLKPVLADELENWMLAAHSHSFTRPTPEQKSFLNAPSTRSVLQTLVGTVTPVLDRELALWPHV
ncbi:hypothetical protein C7C56_017850 [Massilia glaciei]|uniref:HEAT repeat domain-containing protein n=2 Tax=Massilia glaciei TaxID=1524097 RepID=A0A2U2HHL3_9BURK|nr:hypothetical protein C7C56_017850 [Massilia glaciei]